MGMVVGDAPKMCAENNGRRDGVWPEGRGLSGDNNIGSYTAHMSVRENLLFGYWEYHGTDFSADMAKIAASPKNQEWWSFTIPCQQPLESRKQDEWWAMMEETFHHD